ncbi:MAG: glycosyltransferase, partial [Clostridia bacterium]|nr:glycosyltransferase [Clostridia bacterium]
MKENIKFSVVVPVYNIEKYLKKCIDSLISQTYSNLQIILVDDGSTDSSSAICDEYAIKDERITVVHKENEGLISARQAGALRANGDYIACVDGDDWLDERYFQNFASIIDEFSPDIVCCSNFASDGEVFSPANIYIKEGFYGKSDIEEKIFPFLIEDEYG